MSTSDHGSEQQTAGPSEAPAAEVTINIEVSDHWKTRCRQIQRYAADCEINQRPCPKGLTDRHLQIAKKISTLDEAPEGEEQWMSKWGVHPQSWPQFWRSFEKERKTWNVVLSEDPDDLSLEEVAGFGFVDQDQDDDSDIRDEPNANSDILDEYNIDGVPVERDTERNHEFSVSPETSIGHEPAVQCNSQIEHLPPPPIVSRDTNPSTQKTRSKTQPTAPASNVQRAEARMTIETSPREASVENPARSHPHRAAKQTPLATSIERAEALKTSETSRKEIAVGNLALHQPRRTGGPALDRGSYSLTDTAIQFEAPQKPNIPAVAHQTHKSHLVETVAPRTVADLATIPQTALGSHGESHGQRRGLGTCPPRMTQVVERVPVYQAPQSKSPTFIAPAQDQEPYRHDRPPPVPLAEAQTPQPSIATRTQAVSLPKELMFLKPMEALQKARREAKAAGRSRFG